MAETALETGQLDQAESWISKAAKNPEEELQEDVYQEYIFQRARLLQKQGHPVDALKLALLLKPGDSVRLAEYRFVLIIV